MSGWHLGTLAAFDIESTGVDVETARIVTAAIVARGGSLPPSPRVNLDVVADAVIAAAWLAGDIPAAEFLALPAGTEAAA